VTTPVQFSSFARVIMSARQRRAETEPLLPDGADPAPFILLSVIEGPDRDLELGSAGPTVRVGRDDGNDVVLRDTAVSGFHCEISLDEGRIRISDNASRNGLYLNGVRVYDGELRDGCILTVGNNQVRCRIQTAGTTRTGTDPGTELAVSAAMHEVSRLLDSAARSEVTALLTGETGCGKSVAAERIHRMSARGPGPIVTVDCGAIMPTLLESELFGHVRGAFTGATSDRAGAFEEAGGGTLFLDEIGDLPLDLQPVLLRVLETRKVRRVGESAERAVDVRLIAATNRDLNADLEAGRFRTDLYYRLAVLEIPIPPLRERTADIPAIVADLVERAMGGRRDRETLSLAAQLTAPGTLARLQAHPWPGNIRQLRNYIQRCFAFGELVSLAELDAELR
jgi:two-component system, NtrC family, response regulator GlrR